MPISRSCHHRRMSQCSRAAHRSPRPRGPRHRPTKEAPRCANSRGRDHPCRPAARSRSPYCNTSAMACGASRERHMAAYSKLVEAGDDLGHLALEPVRALDDQIAVIEQTIAEAEAEKEGQKATFS